ncbi:MAG: DUF3276 family protein [Treponema sp.]|jgi:hypothetical protein|nr:DUF3276 family protein [Treponema sp.]
MGIRGEIFSTKVILQNRTYFFNVKENRMGDLYLNIVESKNRDSGGFERQSVILFADDLQNFLKGFDDSLRVLEKAIRERKRSGYRRDRPGGDYGESRDHRRDGRDGEYRGDEYQDDEDPGARGRGTYGENREERGNRDNGDRGARGRGAYGGNREERGNRDGFRHGGHGESPPKDGGIPPRKPRRLVAKKRDT